MAMAGQAQLDRVGSSVDLGQEVLSWRQALKLAYYWALLFAGATLLVVFPPQFEIHSISTYVSVALVALFLALNERPQTGFKVIHAPVAAILAAATATVGWWALPLAIVGLGAVHIRLREAGRPLGLSISALAAQMGIAAIAIQAMIHAYQWMTSFAPPAPNALHYLLTLGAILGIGMLWQTINNGLLIVGFAIVGQPASFVRYWRAGFVAALWAYLLAGMYTFGGIVGAVVFYYVVAHTRMFERIIQAVEARDERDFVKNQFHEMIREFVGLLTPDDAQFAGDVRYMALQMGRKLQLPKADLDNLGWAAEFHEIGKCKLRADVREGANLTPSQQQEALRYPMLGAHVLRKAPRVIPEEVAYAVEHQCEAFDGSGYPHGMHGTRIPLAARIIAITRDYMALLTGHNAGGPQSKQDALRTLSERAGTQYDPALVDLLCREIA
ncbi:MAG TPA: HD domain-containing phosphohydrolase [Candidatus Binatus sp.]|nr:HD domain-containing phosphohydrolase [Candidatus Binatus sp.]